MSTSAIIADVRQLLAGEPVFLAGSLVAADTYGIQGHSHNDVDLFCPTAEAVISVGRMLMCSGFTVNDRFARTYERWVNWGMGSWHTNSLKLDGPGGIEYNLVYKTQGRHPVSTLAAVLESFDFGLLGMGYDLKTNTYRDMRDFLFPGHVHGAPLPMMPSKRENWRAGFISQYNGIREVGRYVKYFGYGYDLSLVKDDLAEGYKQASLYFSTQYEAEKQQLGQIYENIAFKIEDDDIADLTVWAKKVEYTDSLDAIMAALE